MICKKCGSIIEDNAKLCSSCGENQVLSESPVREESDFENKTSVSHVISDNAFHDVRMSSKKQVKSMTTKVIIGVLCTILLVVIVIGSMFAVRILLDKQNHSSSNTTNIVGNMPGNLSVYGFAAIQDNWIYYWDIEDERTMLFAAEIDEIGISTHQISTGDVIIGGNINVVGDWIYYFGATIKDLVTAIYAIRTDGSENHKIIEFEDDMNFTYISGHYFIVVNDWIYYTSFNDNHKIYAVKTGGSENHKLNDKHSGYINVVGDHIYYLCGEDKYRIY